MEAHRLLLFAQSNVTQCTLAEAGQLALNPLDVKCDKVYVTAEELFDRILGVGLQN